MSEHHRTSAWKKVIAEQRPRFAVNVRQGTAVCVDCRRLIKPGEQWDIGHRISVAEGRAQGWSESMLNDPTNLGPSHRHCNRSSGGKLGAAIQKKARADDRRMPTW